MRSFLISAACLAVFVMAYAVYDLNAQGVSAPPAAGGVAVVDVGHIFKNHARFKRMMEELKRDVEADEKTLKAERSAINEMGKKLEGLKPGSIDYKRLDEDLTRRQSDWNVKASLKKKTLMERETQIYYNVYREINDEVRYFAERRGVSLVLRFNGEPVDVSNPGSVRGEINKPIVYTRRDIDITLPILSELNRRAVGGQTGGPTAGRTGVAPPRR